MYNDVRYLETAPIDPPSPTIIMGFNINLFFFHRYCYYVILSNLRISE